MDATGAAAVAWPTLGDLSRELSRNRADDPAVVCGVHRLTYRELDLRVDRVASLLVERGIGPGEHVLWLGRNCHRLLELLLAAAKCGAILCPANWRLAPDELIFIIGDVRPRVVIWEGADEQLAQTTREVRDRSGESATWLRHDAATDDASGYEALLAAAPARQAESSIDPWSPVAQLYTAAFEGQPNGALLTHGGLITHGLVMASALEATSELVNLNSAPLFHIAGIDRMVMALVVGGRNVFVPQAEPLAMCELIQRERCTSAYLVQPTVTRMAELNRDGRYSLKSFRSQSFGPEWDAMITLDTSPWGRRPGGFGQTELCGSLTLSCYGGSGTFGHPIPTAQVRITVEDGSDAPVGEVGEIVARGPTVFLGYHDRPALNARRFRDGWYRTNDLGRRERDGSITWVGPRSRLIKSAKENIYPQEVEACLLRHPSVERCAVIGVPDPVWDQSVTAIIVFRPGLSASEAELIEHCRERLASYKKPRRIIVAELLPLTDGRIDYKVVDDRYGGGYPGQR